MIPKGDLLLVFQLVRMRCLFHLGILAQPQRIHFPIFVRAFNHPRGEHSKQRHDKAEE